VVVGPVLSEQQARLLAVVREGHGDWDARRIDIVVSSRHGAAGATVLQQLRELEDLGLVRCDTSQGGVGGRWRSVEEH
jgi:hypothetical protein